MEYLRGVVSSLRGGVVSNLCGVVSNMCGVVSNLHAVVKCFVQPEKSMDVKHLGEWYFFLNCFIYICIF